MNNRTPHHTDVTAGDFSAARRESAFKSHHRKSRAKPCHGWEQFEVETNGILVYRVAKIALRYPSLTPTQLRVAALATGLLPAYEIARILGTGEHAVEKVRSRIRKVLGLHSGESLETALISLLDEKNDALPQMGR